MLSSGNTSLSAVSGNDDPKLVGNGKGALLFRQGWGKFKPAWFELSNDSLMQFSKRGASSPKQVIRLQAAILKSADELLGEENCFALFVPSKDPYYFRCNNPESKASWLSWLTKVCASTEWSTSSMVTAFVDPVVVASQEAIILEVNDAMLKMFGYERKDVIGKNLKTLMPESVAKNHDSYVKAYLDTGVTKLIGKPRALIAKHKDGSDIPLVLSLGVETKTAQSGEPEGQKTFIATLRPDKEKKNMPSKQELDALLRKTVDATLDQANVTIKEALSSELSNIMQRLEEYQASYKLMAAKTLKGTRAPGESEMTTDNDSDTSLGTVNTQRGGGHGTMEIYLNNIQVGHRLGVGGSGNAVYACNVDGWECAMKELKIENAKQSEIDAFSAEIFMLESLPPHKNLVRFLFHEKGHDRIRIFMRRYEGTLDNWLADRRSRDEFLEIGDVARLVLDVVRALEILHDYKILHRDVKSQNLFVNKDQAGNVSHLTLSDFDSAKVVENAAAAKTIIGTVGWMPPEVYSSAGKSYSFSADIWSLGATWFEIMDLGRPFTDIDEFDRAGYIGAGNLPNFRQKEFVEKSYAGLLPIWKKCMALDPEQRPSLRDIKVELSHFL